MTTIIPWQDTANLGQIVAAFLAGYGPSTRKSYAFGVKNWMRWCDDYALEPLKVQRVHIDLWARHLEEERNLAPSSVQHYLCIIRAFYRWCEDEDVILKSPATKVRLPKVSTESQTRNTTRQEMWYAKVGQYSSLDGFSLDAIRYVGLTGTSKATTNATAETLSSERLAAHLLESLDTTTNIRKVEWYESVIASGGTICSAVLETFYDVTRSDLGDAERYWIKELGGPIQSDGTVVQLFNLMPGGSGGWGCNKKKDPRSAEERFLSRVDMSGECWVWTGPSLHFEPFPSRAKHRVRINRFSWELAYGPPSPDVKVLHECGNDYCVRPDHLYLGGQENFARWSPDAIAARFWARVTQPVVGCWEWTGYRNKQGYGQTTWKGRHSGAHVKAWRLAHNNAEIPRGLVVRHTCDNPPCCRPDHLILGTPAQNSADMVKRGRAIGHPGLNHHAAKLSTEQVREIRRLWSSGETARSIAEKFGVSTMTAYRCAVGQSYRDVT